VLPLAQAALAAAEEADRPDLRAWAHIQVGRHSSFLGDVESGMTHFDAGRRLAQEHGLEVILAGADKERAIILECSARFEEALAALESAHSLHARLGFDRGAKHDLALIGQTLHRLGRWAEAEAALDEALRLPPPPWAHVVRAYLLVGMGRWEEAQRALDFAWESVEKSDSSASYGPYYSAQAEMAIWQGRPADALAAVSSAFTQVLDPRWISELIRLGLRAAADIALSADAGKQVAQRESALRQADEGLARARDVLAVAADEHSVYLPEVGAGMLTSEAEVGRARGTAVPAAWAKAADAWLALKEPYPAAYALFRQAEAELAGGGGRTAAETPLRRSIELCREMGAVPLLEMARALARRARIDVGRPPPAGAGETWTVGDYGLTERERDVLALLAEGRSDRQIAEELFISPKTASVHVSNIKGKLGVEHRIEAAAVGLRLGLGDGGRRLDNGDR
jgi:DNA-binding CsgD family transcriptional regulator